ncbi:Ribosomal protein L11 methyltransferase [invertebrate metagenome]|uniref:Ribosomal protein L11 methyltransferase n=1 Tax=invertebrate metagenome TaxID=1711999 RepID=A0A2H9T6G0_9ZZZZ
MPWIQIKIETHPDHTEILEDLLMEAGASAVTLQDRKDQPVYEPLPGTTPLWSNLLIIGLFDAHADMEHVIDILKEDAGLDPFPSYHIEIVEDRDWEREWMVHFHPICFGSRLWVCPSWKEVPKPDAVNLMLDPGLAFGTGTHPTTALCLKWLDQQEKIANASVLDYGCGSGILGIAALLLGAHHVTGVDIDPQALTATAENARRNNLPVEKLQVFLPQDFVPSQFDIVIANILSGPLTQLASKLAEYTKPGGQIALSGLLVDQADAINSAYSPWFIMNQPVQQDGWVMISGVRKP